MIKQTKLSMLPFATESITLRPGSNQNGIMTTNFKSIFHFFPRNKNLQDFNIFLLYNKFYFYQQ